MQAAPARAPYYPLVVHLAVVIPVYNEARWVRACIERLHATPPPVTPEGAACTREIILVDDGSTDGTRDLVRAMGEQGLVTPIFHEANRGKGAAIRTGFLRALDRGAGVVLVHDADLEYDPADHARVLAPILDGRADAVIGSRFIGQTHRVLYYWHYLANRFITTCCNAVTNLNLTDVECCTKAFTGEALRALTLTEDRFGIEIELVAKIARARLARPDAPARRARVYEVAVAYDGRTYEEGKKIGWQDGVAALGCILKHGL